MKKAKMRLFAWRLHFQPPFYCANAVFLGKLPRSSLFYFLGERGRAQYRSEDRRLFNAPPLRGVGMGGVAPPLRGGGGGGAEGGPTVKRSAVPPPMPLPLSCPHRRKARRAKKFRRRTKFVVSKEVSRVKTPQKTE